MQMKLSRLGLAALVAGAMATGQVHAQEEVIFTETMGDSGGTVALSTHIANNGFDHSGTYTYSQGNAPVAVDVRVSNHSGGAYAGASGASNIWFAAASDRGFAITGIDASTYESLTVSMGLRKESGGGSDFSPGAQLHYSLNNGATWTAFADLNALVSSSLGAGWVLIEDLALPAAADEASQLGLMWTSVGSSTAYRLDDVVLKGVPSGAPPPDFTVTGSTANFGAVNADDGPFDHDVTINVTNPVEITPPSPLPANVTLSITGATNFASSGDITVTWDPQDNDGSSINETLTFTTDGNPASFDVTVTGSTLLETSIIDVADGTVAAGTPVIIEGVVTYSGPYAESGALTDATIIQIDPADVPGGDRSHSAIRLSNFDGQNVGDTIRVRGTTRVNFSQRDLIDITLLDTDDTGITIAPVVVDAADFDLGSTALQPPAYPLTGQLLTIENLQYKEELSNARYDFQTEDEQDNIRVRAWIYDPVSDLTIDEYYNVTGFGFFGFSAYNLVPRSSADIVELDTTPPTLTTVTIASDNADPTLAKADDVITVSITADEDITQPTVTIAGQSASVSGSGSSYTATHTVQAGDPQGPAAISISDYEDMASNPGATVTETTDSSSVTIDTVAPVTTVDAPEVFVGTELTITYDATDANDVTETKLYVKTPGETTFVDTGLTPVAGSFIYTAAESGVYEFGALSTDEAGNEEAIGDINAVSVVVNISENAELTLDVETGTDVTVTFPMATGINVTITFAEVTDAGTVSVERIIGALNAASLGLDPDRLGGQVLVITAGGGLAFTTATIVFDIDEALLGSHLADINAIDTVYVNRGGTLTSVSGADVSVDDTEDTVTVTGVDEFSEWYFGDATSDVIDWMQLLD